MRMALAARYVADSIESAASGTCNYVSAWQRRAFDGIYAGFPRYMSVFVSNALTDSTEEISEVYHTPGGFLSYVTYLQSVY